MSSKPLTALSQIVIKRLLTIPAPRASALSTETFGRNFHRRNEKKPTKKELITVTASAVKVIANEVSP